MLVSSLAHVKMHLLQAYFAFEIIISSEKQSAGDGSSYGCDATENGFGL
jgi:hypothetical protein